MQTSLESQSFFVKIEGQCHSNYRNPQGVYKVEVVAEKTVFHSAFAAIQVARHSVPFMAENPDSFTLKAFLDDGQEIIIPRPLLTAHEDKGLLCGRAVEYPETIFLQ